MENFKFVLEALYQELKQREQNLELADADFVQAATYELLATKEKINAMFKRYKLKTFELSDSIFMTN